MIKNFSLFEFVSNSIDKKIIIFGCGDLARCGKAVFDLHNLNVECFFSSKVSESEQECFEGRDVKNPRCWGDDKTKAVVLIAIFDDEKEREIKCNLVDLGFCYFFDKETVIEEYFLRNLKRVGFRIVDDDIYVDKITLMITEKCSLKCKYCGNFVPYINNPINYDKNIIIKSISRMASVVKEISEISLIGGEAFLHHDMNDIIEALCKSKNIKHITITTNGTVIPNEVFWNIASNYKKVGILFSDYGINREKIEKIINKAKEYNIEAEYVCMDYTQEKGLWDKGHVPIPYHRTKKENRNLYITCRATAQCPMLRNGKLYKCSTAAMGECIGLIPLDDKGTVNFLSSDSDKELKQKLKQYILTGEAPLACDYCYSGKLDSVPMGEQIIEKDWNINKLAYEVNGEMLE